MAAVATASTGIRERSQSSARRGLKRFAGYAVLIIFALIYLMPVAIQIATSFKTDADASANPLALIPDPFTTQAWERLFDGRS